MVDIPPELLETARPQGLVAGASSVAGDSLLAELTERARRRLSLAAGVLAGALTVALVLNLVFGVAFDVLVVRATGVANPRLAWAVHVALIPLCLAFMGVIYLPGVKGRGVAALGLVFQVVVALGIALPFYASLGRVNEAALSWLAVWLVFFPLVAPCHAKRAIVGSVLAASTPLIAYAIGRARGEPPASGALLLKVLADNFMAAGLGIVTSRIAFALEREVHEAKTELAQLGSYQLVERIRSGGMGEVWRAEHRLLARPAAVKVILPEILGSNEEGRARTSMARFEREARLTAALESPHSVELYDYGVSADGALYYVMELLDGVDLDDLVQRFGPVPPERCIYLLRQAAASLAEAHAVGLIHRDVKPANLLSCRVGIEYDFVKVVDFGLATCLRCSQASGLAGDERLTGEGFIVGTPAFMSPEAAVGSPDVDGRADVYALGCVGYWLLTGALVFDGANASDIVLAHVRDEPTPPSQRTTTPVPPDLEQLILECLAKEPRDRPTAEGLIERLAACSAAGSWDPVRAKGWWETHRPTSGPGPKGEQTRAILLRSTLPLGPPRG